MKKFTRTETVEEFLARGGKITRLLPAALVAKPDKVKQSNVGPAVIITMGEADLFYGESKKNATSANLKTKKIQSRLDVSALPPEIRAKYIDKVLKDAQQNEQGEDEQEDDTDGDSED